MIPMHYSYRGRTFLLNVVFVFILLFAGAIFPLQAAERGLGFWVDGSLGMEGEIDGQKLFSAEAVAVNDALREGVIQHLQRSSQRSLQPFFLLEGQGAILPDEQTEIEVWEQRLRTAFEDAGKLDFPVAVWRHPEAAYTPAQYAYLFKRTSVVLRSISQDLDVWVGPLDGAQAAGFVKALFEYDMAPYLDGVLVEKGSPEELRDIRQVMDEYDATARLWATGADLSDRPDTFRRWLEALLAGADGMLVMNADAVSGDDAAPEASGMEVLFGMREVLDGYDLVNPRYDRSRVSVDRGDLSVRHAKFYDSETDISLLAFWPDEPIESAQDASVFLDSAFVVDVKQVDPLQGSEEILKFLIADPEKGHTEVLTDIAPSPLFISYKLRIPSLTDDDEREETRIVKKYVMPVEEIIARHQAFDRKQRSMLEHYSADGRINMHFKIAEFKSSIDVATDNRFFFSWESGMEWEQKTVYLNGVRWKSKRIPEIPLIQPEKVNTVPLDLTFDKRYEYRLSGETKVGGRECYRVTFRPLDKEESLYEGKLWIEKVTFARVKTSQTQTHLESPVLSNQQTDHYEPIVAPDGNTYWLLSKIDGQMIFTTAGRNTALNREVLFSNFTINSTEFGAERKASYSSENQMLRDTDEGFRYLVKDENGERVVKEEQTRSSVLMVGGFYHDASLDFPLPLAGIDYFTFDWRGTGTQVNLFFAGLLGTVTITKPELFGTPLEATAEAFAIAIAPEDRFFVAGKEIKAMGVKDHPASLSLSLGLPFAEYFKAKVGWHMAYDWYKKGEKTDAMFTIPKSTATHTARADIRYDRSGFGVSVWGEKSRRSKWEPWGFAGNPNYDASKKSYSRYGISATQDFFFPNFQKVSLTLNAMDGEDLDRFSMTRVSFFGTRIRGFSGSGLRFSRGAWGSAGYTFGISDAMRFEAFVDHARTYDPFSEMWIKSTGVGVGVNFIGPKSTIIDLDMGYGVDSDIPALEGDLEVRLLVFKLFDRKHRKK